MKLYTPQLLLNTYLLCSIENSCWICKEVWGQVFEDFVVRIKSWLLSRGSAQSTFLSLCTTGTKSSIKQIQNRLHSWSGKHNRNMLNFSSQKKNTLTSIHCLLQRSQLNWVVDNCRFSTISIDCDLVHAILQFEILFRATSSLQMMLINQNRLPEEKQKKNYRNHKLYQLRHRRNLR